MIKLIKNNYPYFLLLTAFVSSITILLLTFGKNEAQLIANSYYNSFFDYFFYFATQVVEAFIAPTILLLVLLFRSYKDGIIILVAYLLSGFVTQLLKQTIYNDVKRPTVLLKEELRFIPEYFEFEHRTSNSFPSGHTTAAFSMFVILTLFLKNKNWGYLFGVIAILIGYSRVYLSQHFFEDILVGSLIGTFVSLIVYFWLNSYSFGVLGRYRILGKVHDKKQ